MIGTLEEKMGLSGAEVFLYEQWLPKLWATVKKSY